MRVFSLREVPPFLLPVAAFQWPVLKDIVRIALDISRDFGRGGISILMIKI